MSACEFLSREERAKEFGIDCQTELVWRKWNVGHEYTQKLVIHNVSSRLQVVRFRLPSSKVFGVPFPDPMKLSTGVKHTIDVSFRPLDEVVYNDHIEFVLEEGSRRFFIKLSALRPVMCGDVQRSFDFGYCAVNEKQQGVIPLRNTGTLPFRFKWTVAEPFGISPLEGEVRPHSQQNISISVTLRDATTISGNACVLMHVDEFSQSEKLHLEAIGKYPYLVAAPASGIDFGDLPTGHVAEREFTLTNRSDVACSFTLVPRMDDPDPVFRFSQTEGLLGGQESTTIRASFKPRTTDIVSNDTFVITSPGGNTVLFTCTGTAVGPELETSANMLAFGEVVCGNKSVKVLTLFNRSSVPVRFQVARLDSTRSFHKASPAGKFSEAGGPCPDSPFRLDSSTGVIEPKLSEHVSILFLPYRPINYARRLMILFENQAPLYVDLVGTGYSATLRPAPLLPSHVLRYRALRAKFSADVIISEGGEDLPYEEGDDPSVNEKDHTVSELFLQRPPASVPASDDIVVKGDKGVEYVAPEVELSSTEMDFGSGSHLRPNTAKVVEVHNNTGTRMSCAWSVPGVDSDVHCFSVYPPVGDIEPHSTALFNVTFRPRDGNMHYSSFLECYVYVKGMRSFLLVKEKPVIPPFLLVLHSRGHTFPADREQYIAKADVPFKRLQLPPASVGGQTFVCATISNNGDTTMHWNVDAIGGSQALAHAGVSLWPSTTVVPAHSFQLIAVRVAPREPRVEAIPCKASFNYSTAYDKPFALVLSSFVPKLVVLDSMEKIVAPQLAIATSALHFTPTAIGAHSERDLVLYNPSRIPVRFTFEAPSGTDGQLEMSEPEGIIPGTSSKAVTVSFAPIRRERFLWKVTCIARFETPVQPELRYNRMFSKIDIGRTLRNACDISEGTALIHITGTGTSLALELSPESLDFGTCHIGVTSRQDLTLRNNSDCPITFMLSYRMVSVTSLEENGQLLELPEPETLANFASVLDETTPQLDGGKVITLGNSPFPSESPVDRPLVSFEPSHSGEIPPHGVGRVKLCLRARMRAFYQIQVLCGIKRRAMGSSPSVILTTPRKSHMNLPPSEFAVSAAKATRPGGQPRMPTLKCDAVALAQLPLVAFTDVLCERLESDELARRLHLQKLNRELSQFLTQKEVNFANAKGLLVQPDGSNLIDTLKRFDMRLLPNTMGSSPTVLRLKLENIGQVDADWALKLPSDYDADVERWAQPSEISSEEQALFTVLDNDLFTVGVKDGVLKPGEATYITIAYRHLIVGTHNLPCVLELQKGKIVQIMLSGVTLSSSDSAIDVNETYCLQSVAIGRELPPVQRITFRNIGNNPLQYALDCRAFDRIREEAFDFDIFHCVNPDGVVDIGGTVDVEFVFNPVEAREYKAVVGARFTTVALGPATFDFPPIVKSFELIGRGFHPSLDQLQPEPKLRSHCATAAALKSGYDLPARLSQDTLAFGDMPLHSVCRSVFLVWNTMGDNGVPISFAVDDSHTLITEGLLQMQPPRGTVLPGQFTVCRATLTTGHLPRVLNDTVSIYVGYGKNKTLEEILAVRGVDGHGAVDAQQLVNQIARPLFGRRPGSPSVKHPMSPYQVGTRGPALEARVGRGRPGEDVTYVEEVDRLDEVGLAEAATRTRDSAVLTSTISRAIKLKPALNITRGRAVTRTQQRIDLQATGRMVTSRTRAEAGPELEKSIGQILHLKICGQTHTTSDFLRVKQSTLHAREDAAVESEELPTAMHYILRHWEEAEGSRARDALEQSLGGGVGVDVAEAAAAAAAARKSAGSVAAVLGSVAGQLLSDIVADPLLRRKAAVASETIPKAPFYDQVVGAAPMDVAHTRTVIDEIVMSEARSGPVLPALLPPPPRGSAFEPLQGLSPADEDLLESVSENLVANLVAELAFGE